MLDNSYYQLKKLNKSKISINKNVKIDKGIRVKDLLENKSNIGTYAGFRFSWIDEDKIMHLIKKLKIPKPIRKDDIHTTLLYSRKFLPNYTPAGDIKEYAYPTKFHVFNTHNKKALVILLDSEFCQNRHKELMNEHNAVYDFPEYLPHITLSYDIGNWRVPKWDNDWISELTITNEYMEILDISKLEK